MSKQDQSGEPVTRRPSSHLSPAGTDASTGTDALRPRVGLQVDLHTTAPGPVTLVAQSDHRLRIHAGPPAGGVCASNDRFTYTRGDVDILPAGLSDAWETDDPTTELLVRLSPSLLRRAAEEMGLDADRASLEPRHQFRDPQIEHIAWALDAERAAGHPAGVLYTESLGMALAVHLLRRYTMPFRAGSPAAGLLKTGPIVPARGLSTPQLRRVTSYIEDHLDRDLSLARLASIAGVSASHLKTLFRRSTGLPVHEYVIQRRVERAKLLLRRGELPASQIALEAGFAHQSHMARHMRRVLGVTPSSVTRQSASVAVAPVAPSAG